MINMGKADWIYDLELEVHISCCTFVLPNGKRCGNGPLTGKDIGTGVCRDAKRHSGLGLNIQQVTLPQTLTCAVDMGPNIHTDDFWQDSRTKFVVCGRHKSQYEERPELGPFIWEKI